MNTTDDDDRKAAEWGVRFVVVARFLNVTEAALAVSVLEGAGIEARLRDQHTIGINWFYAPAMGGVALEVPVARRAEATEIFESAGIEVAPLSKEEQASHAAGVERRRHRGLWAIFLFSPWLWVIWWLSSMPRRRRRHEQTGAD